MDSDQDTLSGGLPHSEIPGSTIARISPGLFAACHVLHRLSVPRHPPDALLSRFSRHTQRQRPSSAAILSVQKTLRAGSTRRSFTAPGHPARSHNSLLHSCPSTSAPPVPARTGGAIRYSAAMIFRLRGAPPGLSAKRRFACRPRCSCAAPVVEVNGLEPSTSCLQSRRSPS